MKTILSILFIMVIAGLTFQADNDHANNTLLMDTYSSDVIVSVEEWDPHTFAFDKDGNFWFTAQGGNGVGHFNVTTGESVIIPVPTERAHPMIALNLYIC